MVNNKVITLNLTDCKYLGELHQRIKVAFSFPNFYGENWDAFWDLIWSECSAEKVIIVGIHTLPQEFNQDIQAMIQVLCDNKEYQNSNGRIFDFEIIN